MSDIVALVLPFFGMIALGAIVARLTRQPIEALGWMNTFIVYVALPALFFQLLAQTPFEQLTQWSFIVGAVASTYLVFCIMFAVSMLWKGNIAESTVKAFAASYGNIGFMGPGIALLAFGEAAAVPVALIFCFENIVHFTVAPLAMSLARGDRQSPIVLLCGALKKIVLHPFIIATAAGVLAAWSGWRVPLAVDTLLVYLAAAAAPCALFAMGVTLALRPLKRLPAELGVITPLKLIIHPLICYLILTSIGGIPTEWIYTAVLLAALPTATNVFVIAQQYHSWTERASASILVTTILSVGTVSVLLYLIKSGSIPV